MCPVDVSCYHPRMGCAGWDVDHAMEYADAVNWVSRAVVGGARCFGAPVGPVRLYYWVDI